MSTQLQRRKEIGCTIVLTLAWLAAAAMDRAHAQAWVPVHHAELDAVFVAQDAVLGSYRRVLMDPLSVWFGESDTASAEIDRHLDAFRAVYAVAFKDKLAARGLELVDQPGPGVLRVHVEIVDLMVNGYTAEQLVWADRFRFPTARERLTLVAELSDSSTGAVLMRAADLGMSSDGLDVWRTVRRSFDVWADNLAGVVVDHGRTPALASR